jgi:hypothetical protein
VLGVSLPPVQAAPQLFVAGASLQALRFVPSQLPPQIAGSPAHAARLPRGTPSTATHLPAEPVSLQASHCPVHPVSQQTPSTQKPDAHSRPSVQVAPGACFVAQVLADVQYEPETQSASPSQLVRQEVEPHRYGAHGVVDVSHVPAPLQVLPLTLPALQVVEPHGVPTFA